jgi:hypothetical protein
MNAGRAGPGTERGLAPATELVIIFPALILLLGVMVAGGRIWFTRSAVTESAYSGARAASIERTPAVARSAGLAATRRQLDIRGVDCLNERVDLDLTGFGAAVGVPASVTERIRCQVPLHDVLVPGLPGTLAISGHGSSPIDTYRER